MFLDDELEAIYTENGFNEQTSVKLIKACIKRIPRPEEAGVQGFLNKIREIEGGWKLFCKKHHEYDPDGFREFMINYFKITDEQVLDNLHWK